MKLLIVYFFHPFPPDALSVLSVVPLTLLLCAVLLLSCFMQISQHLQVILSAHVVSVYILYPVFTFFLLTSFFKFFHQSIFSPAMFCI